MTRFALTALEEGIGVLRIASDEQPYMDETFVAGFAAALERVAADAALRVLLLAGGTRYFSAGASRDSLMHADARQRVTTYAAEVPRMVLRIAVPTIAVMEGHAIGGGLALGLWCDFAVLSDSALYGANFMALGFTPGMGSTVVLEEALGAPLARELLFTGRLIKGRELRESGAPLSPFVVAREEVHGRALQLAREVAMAPREALLLLKSTLTARRTALLEQALASEQSNHAALFASDATRQIIDQRYAAAVPASRGEER